MNSMKFLCLLTYGFLIASIGFKIYEKYKNVEPEVAKPCQEPEKEVKVEQPPIRYGRTSTGKRCIVIANYSDSVIFDEFVVETESFVQRQFNNESKEIECFFEIDTDRYRSTEYLKKRTSEGFQMKLVFERRVTTPREEANCAKFEFVIDSSNTNIEIKTKCNKMTEEEFINYQIYVAIFIVVFTMLLLVIVALVVTAVDSRDDRNAAVVESTSNSGVSFNEQNSVTEKSNEDNSSDEDTEQNHEVNQMSEPMSDDRVLVQEEAESAAQVDSAEEEVFVVPVVDHQQTEVDNEKEDCNQLVDDMITRIEEEVHESKALMEEAESSDMEISSEDDFEHVN